MIPDTKEKKFESAPLKTISEDVEKGRCVKEKVQEKFGHTTFVTLTSGLSWARWGLMAGATFLIWFLIFALIGVTNNSCSPQLMSESPIFPLKSQVINADTSNVYLTILGSSDDLSVDEVKTVGLEGQKVEEFQPSPTPGGKEAVGQSMSDNDNDALSKLLSLGPGWNVNERVYVAEPLVFPSFSTLSDKNKENLFDPSWNEATSSPDKQMLAKKLLEDKEEEFRKDPMKFVETFVTEMIGEVNPVGNGGGVKSLSEYDQEEFQTSSEQSSVKRLQGQIIDHVDPGFVTVPIQPFYVSPKELKLNWFEALQACWAKNMELVAIQDNEENQQVLDYVQKSLDDGDDDDFWTAGTNLWVSDRGEFHWATTGEKFSFTKWHHGNPSSPRAENQNCVQLTKSLDSPTQGSFMWNDYGCHYKTRFICEDPMRHLRV